jgi:hypothetical protein
MATAVFSDIILQGMQDNLFDFEPQIASLDDGGFVVTWWGETNDWQYADIFVQRFDSDGLMAGSTVRLQGAQGFMFDAFPKIVALSGGKFAITWSGATVVNGPTDVFVQNFNANGTLGNKLVLQGVANPELADERPEITALINGGYVVAWHGLNNNWHWDLFIQRFNESGEMIGEVISLGGLLNRWVGTYVFHPG